MRRQVRQACRTRRKMPAHRGAPRRRTRSVVAPSRLSQRPHQRARRAAPPRTLHSMRRHRAAPRRRQRIARTLPSSENLLVQLWRRTLSIAQYRSTTRSAHVGCSPLFYTIEPACVAEDLYVARSVRADQDSAAHVKECAIWMSCTVESGTAVACKRDACSAPPAVLVAKARLYARTFLHDDLLPDTSAGVPA